MEITVDQTLLNNPHINASEACGCFIHKAIVDGMGIDLSETKVMVGIGSIDIGDDKYSCNYVLREWQNNAIGYQMEMAGEDYSEYCEYPEEPEPIVIIFDDESRMAYVEGGE